MEMNRNRWNWSQNDEVVEMEKQVYAGTTG